MKRLVNLIILSLCLLAATAQETLYSGEFSFATAVGSDWITLDFTPEQLTNIKAGTRLRLTVETINSGTHELELKQKGGDRLVGTKPEHFDSNKDIDYYFTPDAVSKVKADGLSITGNNYKLTRATIEDITDKQNIRPGTIWTGYFEVNSDWNSKFGIFKENIPYKSEFNYTHILIYHTRPTTDYGCALWYDDGGLETWGDDNCIMSDHNNYWNNNAYGGYCIQIPITDDIRQTLEYKGTDWIMKFQFSNWNVDSYNVTDIVLANIGEGDAYRYTLTPQAATDAGGIIDIKIDNGNYIIKAEPSEGYRFTYWSDGSTQNPRLIDTEYIKPLIYTNNQATLTANFERTSVQDIDIENYIVSATEAGTITYQQLSCPTHYQLTATANSGYIFVGWSDGNNQNPVREVEITGRQEVFSANFLQPQMKLYEWGPNYIIVATQERDLSSTSPSVYFNKTLQDGATVQQIDRGIYKITTNSFASNEGKTFDLQMFSSACGFSIDAITTKVPVVITSNSSTLPAIDNLSETELVIRDDARFTQSAASVAVKNLYVYDNSVYELASGKSLTTGNMYMWARDNNYPQAMIDGSLTTEDNIIYYDYSVDANVYYTLSVPYTTYTLPSASHTGIQYTDGTQGSYEIMYYDGEQRATGATGWKTLSETTDTYLAAGKGYTIYGVPKKWNKRRQQDAVLRMPMQTGSLAAGEAATKTVSVTAFAAEKVNDANWNLVGNPYLADLNAWDDDDQLVIGLLEHELNAQGKWTGGWVRNNNGLRYVTIPYDNGTRYEQVRTSEAHLKSFNNFFVQVSKTGALEFSKAKRSIARMAAKEQQRQRETEIELLFTDDTDTDKTTIIFSDEFTAEYDMNADLAKMSGTAQKTVVYSIQDGTNLAFQALPNTMKQTAIPVGFKAANDGFCTFSLANADKIEGDVMLTDIEEGRTINLKVRDYMFYSRGNSDKRFYLNLNLQDKKPTAIEENADEQLIAIYDILGRAYHISQIDNLPAGAYLFVKMQYGECVTEKIVVR